MQQQYDVLVVGGGAAGLSAALTLARARRPVLVVDAGRTRNAAATAVHGYLGREGVTPAELVRLGRDEVRGYGGEVADGEVVSARRLPEEETGGRTCFEVVLADGTTVRARRLLVAAGMEDELPDVPGLVERWGRDVLHCPYCHGHEVADRQIALLATAASAVDEALLLRSWSASVTLVLHGAPEPGERREELAAMDVGVVTGPVVGLETDGDRLVGLRLADGDLVPCEAVVVQPLVSVRTDLLARLGLGVEEPTDEGGPIDRHLPTDPAGRTAVAGVWAAGNVRDPGAQVVTAASDGLHVATAVTADLVAEDVRSAVEDRRRAARGGAAPARTG